MSKMSIYQYEHASLLLPWYITGQLSVSEREEVESILDQSPALQRELEQQKNIARMVNDDPNVLDIVAIRTQEQRLGNLLERIDASQSKQVKPSTQPMLGWVHWPMRIITRYWSRLDGLLQSLSPHWTRIAFSLFVVTQVAILAAVLKEDDSASSSTSVEYKSASDSKYHASLDKSVLIFQFARGVKQTDIDKLFEEIDAEIVGHPEGSESYTVALSGSRNNQQIDDLIQRLEKDRKMILLVGRGL